MTFNALGFHKALFSNVTIPTYPLPLSQTTKSPLNFGTKSQSPFKVIKPEICFYSGIRELEGINPYFIKIAPQALKNQEEKAGYYAFAKDELVAYLKNALKRPIKGFLTITEAAKPKVFEATELRLSNLDYINIGQSMSISSTRAQQYADKGFILIWKEVVSKVKENQLDDRFCLDITG